MNKGEENGDGIIGRTGGIGFRHFQAILNCKSDISLYTVDIDEKAVDRARKYAEESNYNKLIVYLNNVDDITKQIFEVVIVLDGSLVENEIYESKRKGYIEFYRRFSGKIGDNVRFVIECDHGNNATVVDIYTEEFFIRSKREKKY